MLALDLYFREGPNAPRSSTEDLSAVLRSIPIEAELAAEPSFRSEASVRRKLGNFSWIDPAVDGGLTNASSLDRAVWDEFNNDRVRLSDLAARIRATLASSATTETEDPDPDFAEAPEGAVLSRLHRFRERNRKLVRKKKAAALKTSHRLACEVCGFVYAERYGELGQGFIECHHTVPVSELQPGAMTHLDDLALVCASCHRMIHRRQPWLTISELMALLAADAHS